jgi:hypothetical protein
MKLSGKRTATSSKSWRDPALRLSLRVYPGFQSKGRTPKGIKPDLIRDNLSGQRDRRKAIEVRLAFLFLFWVNQNIR